MRCGENDAKNFCCDSLFIRYNAPMAVTRRQKEILDFLESFVTRNGYSPSFEEIGEALGVSAASVCRILKEATA